jgi:O-antigen ligase
LLRKLVDDPRFAFAELILVLICGAIGIIKPELAFWFLPIALVPWFLRAWAGKFPFKRTMFDWAILLFLVTAGVASFIAYDTVASADKFFFILVSLLLYYALCGQPRENLGRVSVLLFCLGVGISLYYFLTYDFVAAPRKLDIVNAIGRWIMDVRPPTSWSPIHPNYVAGVVAVTVPFILYPVSRDWQSRNRVTSPYYVFVVLGLIVVGSALFMTTSRGVLLAVVCAAGAWFLWRLTVSNGIQYWLKSKSVFSIVLLVYLCAVIAFLFLGPAQSGSAFSAPSYYGNGSRSELFERSMYLFLDYPFTGGGLGSFPGLYSEYLLNIPFFNVSNSHDLFMDVFIEQGVFGGLSFLFIYVTCLWVIAEAISRTREDQLFRWIVLFCLIVAVVHGMVDNYLYNGSGSMLALFLAGLVRSANPKRSPDVSSRPETSRGILALSILLLVLVAIPSYSQICGMWFANLGAVQLAKVELAGFPESGWAGLGIVPKLQGAESALQVSLQFDPANLTANYRLGLIYMLRRDFESASKHLESARLTAPNHRGIKKSLGYAYLWRGELYQARQILAEFPEASEELDVYYWWWNSQDRADLANHAYTLLRGLNSGQTQP